MAGLLRIEIPYTADAGGSFVASARFEGELGELIADVTSRFTGATVEADDDVWTTASSRPHYLAVGDTIVLKSLTDGTGLTAGTTYYVVTVPSATTFEVSLTAGGGIVNVTLDATAVVFDTNRAAVVRAAQVALAAHFQGNLTLNPMITIPPAEVYRAL